MTDKDFLVWIRDRLHFQHGEKLNVDYMLKLKAIIEATSEDRLTPNGVPTTLMGIEYGEINEAPQRG